MTQTQRDRDTQNTNTHQKVSKGKTLSYSFFPVACEDDQNNKALSAKFKNKFQSPVYVKYIMAGLDD